MQQSPHLDTERAGKVSGESVDGNEQREPQHRASLTEYVLDCWNGAKMVVPQVERGAALEKPEIYARNVAQLSEKLVRNRAPGIPVTRAPNKPNIQLCALHAARSRLS